MVRRCARSRNLVNEEALAHWGAVAPKKKKYIYIYIITLQCTAQNNIKLAYIAFYAPLSKCKVDFMLAMKTDGEWSYSSSYS